MNYRINNVPKKLYINQGTDVATDAFIDRVLTRETDGLSCSRGETNFITAKRKATKQKIKEMIDYQGPVVFDCIVDPRENVYPMIPAGAAHYEIELGPDHKQDIELDKNRV